MARELVRRSLPSGQTARVVMSEAADGDLAVGGPEDLLTSRRKAVVAGRWTWLHQVHGTTVVDVSEPGGGSGSSADALVTATTVAPLAVQVADCVPVALISPTGVVAIAHAGWRGLADGVLERTAEAVLTRGGRAAEAVVGPHIGACCYEFGQDDLQNLVDQLGPSVRSRTSDGRPAADLAAAVRAVLDGLSIPVAVADGTCTSCDDRYWSYRATGTACRQAMVVVLEEAA